MTPAERAARALADAEAWIRASPPLIDVLSWHRDRCGDCEDAVRTCREYAEIITEYGAGTCGLTGFWPEPPEVSPLPA